MARDIWISLFLLGALFFGWPIISIFGFGTAAYLFSAWLIFIAILFFTTTYSDKKTDGG